MNLPTIGGTLIGFGALLIAYTYVLYPALLLVLAHRDAGARTLPPARLVSIVIAARNAGESVCGKVAHLLATVVEPCEVVVVLDGPDSVGTAALARLADDRLKVIALPHPVGKAEALNRGVAEATGDVLVFTDVRQRVAPGAVERLVAGLRSPEVGAISGALHLEAGSGAPGLFAHYWRLERKLRRIEAERDSAVGVTGALYAMRRELWSPLPEGLILDDVWIPMRIVKQGYRVGFDRDALVLDVRVGADASEFARKVRTLTGNYQLIAWEPWLLSPLQNRIWWQFISHKVLRLFTPVGVIAIAAGAVLYGARQGVWLAASFALLAVLAMWSSHLPARTPGLRGLRLIRSALVMQFALVIASMNALRGRWAVWSVSTSAAPDPAHALASELSAS